jgi:hypothetical protein
VGKLHVLGWYDTSTYASSSCPVGVSSGNRENRVASGGHGLATHEYIAAGHERSRCIRASTPDLAEGNQAAINLATFCPRAGIVGFDGLATAEIARGGGGRAGFAAPTGSEDGEGENQAGEEGDTFLRGLSF